MYFIGEVIDNMLADRGGVRLIARNKLATKPRRVARHDALVCTVTQVYKWLRNAQKKHIRIHVYVAKAANKSILAALAGIFFPILWYHQRVAQVICLSGTRCKITP